MEFLCIQCGVQCANQKALSKHNEVRDERSFPCGDCEKILIGKKAFNNHKRVHVLTACKICWRQVTVQQLGNHEFKCSGAMEQTSFQSPICPYISSSNTNLRKHVAISTVKCIWTLLVNKITY